MSIFQNLLDAIISLFRSLFGGGSDDTSGDTPILVPDSPGSAPEDEETGSVPDSPIDGGASTSGTSSGGVKPIPPDVDVSGVGNESGGDPVSIPEPAPIQIIGGSIDVMAGRVATIMPEGDDIASIRILSGVENGTLTVNPDNTLALAMTQSDFTGTMDFQYEVTDSSGVTAVHGVNINVSPGVQGAGWGTGQEHYMLATDENDNVIVEHGENHVKVYISGSADALTIADIAGLHGMSTSAVTGTWLADNGYGQSEGLALAEDAGMLLWHAVTPWNSETSNWLLLESGYEYGSLGRIHNPGAVGESEMHPLYIGSWGDGPKPILAEKLWPPSGASNVVVQDVHFTEGVFMLNTANWIFDDVTVTDNHGMVIQVSSGITVRNSDFYDIIMDAPTDVSSDGNWFPHSSRVQGYFAHDIDGALLENTLFDHTGWADDYTGSAADGQPPSMYSHNIYFSHQMSDTVSWKSGCSWRIRAQVSWGARRYSSV